MQLFTKASPWYTVRHSFLMSKLARYIDTIFIHLYSSEIPLGRDADNVPAWTWIEVSPSLLQVKHFHCTVSLHMAHALIGSNSWPHDLHSIWISILYTKSLFNGLILLASYILKNVILSLSCRKNISNINLCKRQDGPQKFFYINTNRFWPQ